MIIAVLGWLGASLYLMNHFYISFFKNFKYSKYYIVNFMAAALLVLTSFYLNSWQSVVFNLFWMIISLCGYYQISLLSFNMPLKMFKVLIVLGLLISIGAIKIDILLSIALMGWLSVFIFVIGYLSFSSKILSINLYLFLSAFAALILIPQLYLDNNIPIVFLEVCWVIISLNGLLIRFFQKPNSLVAK